MPALLAVATVLAQVAYPLVEGTARDVLTAATVLLFLSTTVAHATATRGPAWASSYLALVVPLAFAAEAVGVATGLPFGDYRYDGSLGPRVLDVPLLVPLAWAMFAYPALLVGRRLGAPVLTGALALTAWDVFLDPQMVDAGHWRWLDVRHPLVDGVPVSNTVGWLAVSLVLMALLDRLPDGGDDRLPVLLYVWTWASSVLANLAFFGRPEVALLGGLAMGVPAVLAVRR